MADVVAPLTDEERGAIRDAVRAAEQTTSGEIFVVVAQESDDYRIVPLLWAMLAALIVPLPLILFTLLSAGLIYGLQLGVFIVLALVLSYPPIKAAVTPGFVKDRACRTLAVQQFLAHGVHMTERRTGVLILVSLFEHRAEIVADNGINAKVDQVAWDAAMYTLIGEIRAGRLAAGLIAAVGSVGAVLAAHFPRRLDDVDELADDVVIL